MEQCRSTPSGLNNKADILRLSVVDTDVTRDHNHTTLVGLETSRGSDDFGPRLFVRATERPFSIDRGEDQTPRTYLLRSSPVTFGLTSTVFRNILAMVSSRKITISCAKNFKRQGLVAKCTFGTFALSWEVKDESIGFRGRVTLLVRSSGPGTKTK